MIISSILTVLCVNGDLVTAGIPTRNDTADITLNKGDSHGDNTYVLQT
jgi:hypothetical protein